MSHNNGPKNKKVCGIFVFTKDKKLLLVKNYKATKWEIPTWDHSGHEDHLSVAQTAIFEKTGLEYFNYKDELFKTLSHQFGKSLTLVPYVIFGEEDDGEDFDPWDDNVDCIDFFHFNKCKNMLHCPLQKNALSQIKFRK